MRSGAMVTSPRLSPARAQLAIALDVGTTDGPLRERTGAEVQQTDAPI
jgi:hypothetical protein